MSPGFVQGSYLGTFVFDYLFINDIGSVFQSSFQDFKDKVKIFREIVFLDQKIKLQNDLERIKNWCHEIAMDFNTNKVVSNYTRTRLSQYFDYLLDGVTMRT